MLKNNIQYKWKVDGWILGWLDDRLHTILLLDDRQILDTTYHGTYSHAHGMLESSKCIYMLVHGICYCRVYHLRFDKGQPGTVTLQSRPSSFAVRTEVICALLAAPWHKERPQLCLYRLQRACQWHSELTVLAGRTPSTQLASAEVETRPMEAWYSLQHYRMIAR
jgi:hypothetical protein